MEFVLEIKRPDMSEGRQGNAIEQVGAEKNFEQLALMGKVT